MSFNNPFKNFSKEALKKYFQEQDSIGNYSDKNTIEEKAKHIKSVYGENTLASNFATDVLEHLTSLKE